jgi:Arm DNA-binding domain
VPKLTKRVVDAADIRQKDYVLWDDELPGFGLRVFATGKRSYVIQYRTAGRSRRYTIGLHGVWTPETARQEAKAQLGRVAQGENPAEERQLDQQAITVKELCELYLRDLEAGLILGKGGAPQEGHHHRNGYRPHPTSHHTADRQPASERPCESRHQQGPKGHHGGEDPHVGQDQEAPR